MDFRGGGGGGGGGKKRPNSSSGGKSSSSSNSRYNVTPPQQPNSMSANDQMNQLLLQQYFLQQQQEQAQQQAQQQQQAQGGANLAAAMQLFGNLLGDKLGGGGGGGGQGGGGGGSNRDSSREREQQLTELFAAAAAAQQQQQSSSSSNLHGGGDRNSSSARSSSNTPSPSPRISSPHTTSRSSAAAAAAVAAANSAAVANQNAATAAALQQLTAAAAALQGTGNKKDLAALAAQQQWMYLDYIQRMQQEAQVQAQQAQQQQQQHHNNNNSEQRGGGGGKSNARGRSNSQSQRNANNNNNNERGGSSSLQQQLAQQIQRGGGNKNSGNNRMGGQKQASSSSRNNNNNNSTATTPDLSRLFEQYSTTATVNSSGGGGNATNSLLKSSVLASAKLPADTEIIVQKNSGGGGSNRQNSSLLQQLKQQVHAQQLHAVAAAAPVVPTHNKRGPKPKNLHQQNQNLHHHQVQAATITSEQAKLEQQLINLGNNNAITITPANLDMKSSGGGGVSGGGGGASSSSSQAPITITPATTVSSSSSSGGDRAPPAAHSTPFRYGNDKRESKSGDELLKDIQPAHKYIKELYTHVIPRKPQIGLIGPNTNRKVGGGGGGKNVKGGGGGGMQHHHNQQFRHHRPWIIEPNSDVVITPSNTATPPPLNLNKEPKSEKSGGKYAGLSIPKLAPEPIIISPPDYSIPIKDGWKREMILKVFDLNEENLSLACEVTYISPEGKVFSSLNEIKKANIPDPKNFTFNSKIQLGRFVLPGSEGITRRFEYEDLVDYFNERKQLEAIRKRNLRMKHEHNTYVKLLEAYRKNKRKLKLSENKKKTGEEVVVKSNEVEELIDDLDTLLPVLVPVVGKKLNDKTFANLLQIHEFLHTFGETLGFDTESLPSLTSLQKAFLHVEDNEEELVSVLCHLLVCAVEDPGLPNPTGTKHLTPFGQTLRQADVTFGSMSEILRIYLTGIADSEPEAEEYAEWLEMAPFTAQSAFRKSTIVAFICDVLLQNKAVLKYLDNCSELIHNCKKEKQQNEIRVRKLRMLVARKQVAASIEEEGVTGVAGGTTPGGGGVDEKADNRSNVGDTESGLVSAGEDSMMQGEEEKPLVPSKDPKDPGYAAVASVADSISSDPDSKLTIEELNSKMQSLNTTNEKLKKQMQNNSKSIRSVCMGQDRWRRRYWNLHFGGGIYVEGGATGEFESVRDAVKEKFEKNPEPPEELQPMEVEEVKQEVKIEVKQEVKQEETMTPVKEEVAEQNNSTGDNNSSSSTVTEVKEEGGGGGGATTPTLPTTTTPLPQPQQPPPPTTPEVKRSTPFQVPPPVIKIFSFAPRIGCSGKLIDLEDTNVKPTDDELLVKHIQGRNWYEWRSVGKQEELDALTQKLCEKGIREKNLKNQLVNCNFKKIPDLRATELESLVGNPEDDGFVDPELLYKIHLGLIETLETLEERVASASLQVKGWVLPNRNLIQENLTEEQIVKIVKERVLDLENAVERRYLKPPLGKSGLEVNLTQLLKETEDVSYNLLMDGPIGSTSSTRGQQINENNKLKMELKEKERIEKELAARKEKEEGGGGKGESRFLNHWRDSIGKTTSPSVLSMAIYILDSCIAWDKSVMKASCQLCKGGDNEDKLLLCDACDRGYHTYCFKPPLDNIPDGDWFCWECINKATGNKCCIVCGKGQIPNVKLLCCDKCVKAYHQDCITPPVTKAPRGRWFCPDHSVSDSKGKVTLSQAVSVSMNSSSGGGGGGGGGVGGGTPGCGSSTSLSDTRSSLNASANATPTSSSKKGGSPKKKGSGRASERGGGGGGGGGGADGNVSDSSNSSSFVGAPGNTTPAASQESDGGDVSSSGGGGGGGGGGRSSGRATPVSSKKESKKKSSSSSSSSSKKGKKDSKAAMAAAAAAAAAEEEAAAAAAAAEEEELESDHRKESTASASGDECVAPTPEKPAKMSKKQKNELAWCENLLDDLVGHDEAWPFLQPVNTRQFPTYKKIIKNPMDLQTIRTRLVASHYKNKDAFLEDVRLIFDNCETFNEDDSPVGKAGFALRTFFESKPGVGAGGNTSSSGNGSGGGGGGGK